jgi:ribonuclease HI
VLTIYTDGANSLKRQIGGCAAVITKDNQILKELSEHFEGPNVTNNTMELEGVIMGCQYVLDHPELGRDVTIVSDSEYVVNGSSKWLEGWKAKGWKTKAGLVRNKVLWEAVDYLKTVLNLTFKWTKGHAGNTLNNLADELAVGAYTKLIKQ